jgi:hypothetical protein
MPTAGSTTSASRRWSLAACSTCRPVAHHQVQELAKGHPCFQIMAEVGLADHLVAIASSHLLLAEIAVDYQVMDDQLHRPLGDPDGTSDVPRPCVRVSSQRDQDVPMVGEERPPCMVHRNQTTRKTLRQNCRLGRSVEEVDHGPRSRGRRWLSMMMPVLASRNSSMEIGASGVGTNPS